MKPEVFGNSRIQSPVECCLLKRDREIEVLGNDT
jgi:hypothetical protein